MKSSKVNGFLVIAIILTVIFLAGTVYGGILLFSQKKTSLEETRFSAQSLDLIPNGNLSRKISVTKKNTKFLSDLFMISKETSIPLRDFGFNIHNVVDFDDSQKDKLFAVGIDDGIHKGGLILKTSDNIAVASRHGFFASNPMIWSNKDYKNLSFYLEDWVFDGGEISGETSNLESFTHKDGITSWVYHGQEFILTSNNLIHKPKDDLYSVITDSNFIPTLPPVLFLGLICLLLILSGIFLWKMGNYDLSLACFYAVPAIIGIGGISVFVTNFLSTEIIPLVSFLGGGLVFSIPIILLWVGLTLEKLLGYFWVIIATITSITIANYYFSFTWMIFIGLLTITVIILAICIPVRNKA